jgi:hypothetical protein
MFQLDFMLDHDQTAVSLELYGEGQMLIKFVKTIDAGHRHLEMQAVFFRLQQYGAVTTTRTAGCWDMPFKK